jgi:hypothetical protein
VNSLGFPIIERKAIHALELRAAHSSKTLRRSFYLSTRRENDKKPARQSRFLIGDFKKDGQ